MAGGDGIKQMPVEDEILNANQAFYDAFARGDFVAIDALWSRKHPVSVVHPGWGCLHGREAVMDSWRRILEGGRQNSIRCEQPVVYQFDRLAYVLCREVFPEGELIATNILALEEGQWCMVHHQAGPLQRPSSVNDQALH